MTITAGQNGHDSRYCGAKTRSGKPCTRPAGWGTDHAGVGTCKLHLGSTGSHRAAGVRMLAERAARASLADVVVEPIENPLEALAEVVAEARAWQKHLANTLAELRDQYRFTDDKGAEQLDARVALYERASDRCQKFLTDWVRLGLDERLVRVSEAQAAVVAAAVTRALGAMGLGDREPEARRLVAAELRAIDVKGRER